MKKILIGAFFFTSLSFACSNSTETSNEVKPSNEQQKDPLSVSRTIDSTSEKNIKLSIQGLPKEYLGQWVEQEGDCGVDFGLIFSENDGKQNVSGHEWEAEIIKVESLENGFIKLFVKGVGYGGDEEYEINRSYILKIQGDKLLFNKETWGLVSNEPWTGKNTLMRCKL